MTQTLHRFKAESLDQAYRAMRRKLGDDAVVLRTTTVTEGGILGFLGRKMIEVTASSNRSSVSLRKLSPVEKRYAAVSAASLEPSARRPRASRSGMPINEDTLAYYEELVDKAQRRMSGIPAKPVDGAQSRARLPERKSPDTSSAGPNGENAPAPVSKELQRDIRNMLDVLAAEIPGTGLATEHVPYYRDLLDRGLDRTTAAGLVNAAAKAVEPGVTAESQKIFRERLKMEVRRHIAVTEGIHLEDGQCHVVALVGPTGVGKTTNLAKLAAIFSVKKHAKVGVITADTYRIAASDQLQVYANIIDLEMKVAPDDKEMAEAIRHFRGHDLVLIDTAGGSPYNTSQMDEIREVLAAAKPDEVMMVLSASTPLEDLEGIAAQFSCLNPTSLLFTKLDETRRCGPMYCLAASGDVPLSYFHIGPNVPDDVLLADVGTIASMVGEGGKQRGGSGTKTS